MSLLEIKNLNVRFGDKTAVPVVDGLDISVDKGEVLAIVGESGSGKSVTMMALMSSAREWLSGPHGQLLLEDEQRVLEVGPTVCKATA